MNKITHILFFLTIFCIGFLPVKDTDFGWHYRCGNQFLTTGKLCISNEFSYYLSDYKAYYSGHLYDILLALIYNNGGFIAVSLAGALIFTFSSYLFLKLVTQNNIIKMSVFFVIFFLSISIFGQGLRPQIISYSLTLLLLNILQHKNSKILYVLPLLFFLWVNFHIGFFVGLILLGFAVFQNKSIRKFPFLVICLASFLSTLINPFGYKIYVEIANHAFAPLNTMIAEWVRPSTPHIILIIILTTLSIFFMIKNKTTSLFKILLLFFFMFLTLKANRNLPFFYTIAFYILLNELKLKYFQFQSVILPLLISVLFFFTIIQVPQTINFDTKWNVYCEKTTITPFPCDAIQNYSKLSGNVFTNYEWGGFLIWKKPNTKVFVDGRMSAWIAPNKTYPYQTYLEIIQTKNNWNEKLKKLKTDYIFIAPETYLDLLLQKEQVNYGWKKMYQDNFAVIYKSI